MAHEAQELLKREDTVRALRRQLADAKESQRKLESEMRRSVSVEKQTRGKNISILTSKEGVRWKASRSKRGFRVSIREEIDGKFEAKASSTAHSLNDARLMLAFESSKG